MFVFFSLLVSEDVVLLRESMEVSEDPDRRTRKAETPEQCDDRLKKRREAD